jgi:hypothetical protein
MTTFYCLRFETPPTCRTRFPYLYRPGTGWPSYIPRHRVPFSSPPMARRATVEVFDSASIRVHWLNSKPLRTTVETPRFHCYSSTVALFLSAGTRSPSRCLGTGPVYPLLTWSLHSNGCFSGSTFLALSKYATILRVK